MRLGRLGFKKVSVQFLIGDVYFVDEDGREQETTTLAHTQKNYLSEEQNVCARDLPFEYLFPPRTMTIIEERLDNMMVWRKYFS